MLVGSATEHFIMRMENSQLKMAFFGSSKSWGVSQMARREKILALAQCSLLESYCLLWSVRLTLRIMNQMDSGKVEALGFVLFLVFLKKTNAVMSQNTKDIDT